MLGTSPPYTITWEKLPDDFVLPDDPVDNINKPTLAAALTESLELAGKLPETALTPTHYAICATLNGKFVVKAPDWAYIPHITVKRSEVERSYTPRLQGEIPALVLEFLSETEGGEYSMKQTYPPGKFFYYEQILQVPNYGIFDLKNGTLELYRLGENQRYQLESAHKKGHYWIPEMQLFLGVWQGRRENRSGYWLRWWDEPGNLLLWSTERIEQERQRAEQERQRAERLAAQLRAAGIEPSQISDKQPREFDAVLGGQNRLSVPSQDQELVLRLNPIADAHLYDYDPDRCYSDFCGLSAGAWTHSGVPTIIRGLLKFDIPLESNDRELLCARLSLFAERTRPLYGQGKYNAEPLGHSQQSGSNQWLLLTLASAWSEETVTWNTQPKTMEPVQIMPASSSPTQNYKNIDITPLVRFCIDRKINHGFLMKLEREHYYRQVTFHSRKTEQVDLRPRLDLYYTIK